MKLIIRTAEDISATRQAQEQEAKRAEARAYLNETDWLVVRQAETGTSIPEAVLQARARARVVLQG